MREDSSNPPKNKIPTGIKEDELFRAIEMSGYPLQGLVAGKLNNNFSVTEEWGYIDRDTKEHRSLDIFASKSLFNNKDALVHPELVLLIECKKSLHPFVFFKNVPDNPIPNFPKVAGLPYNRVSINERSGKRSRDAPGSMALGIDKLPFVEPGPPKCAAFSKAIPSGKKVELSGADPFNGIILHLVKVLDHASQLYSPGERPDRIFPALMFCISVVDAPMLLVEVPGKASDPILIPWVRVMRQEASPGNHWNPYRFYAVDIIHIDAFEEIIDKQIMPFAEEFARRAVQLEKVLLQGGEVSDLDNWEWNQIQPRSIKHQK